MKKRYYLFKFDFFIVNVFSIILLIIMFLISNYFFEYNIFSDLYFKKTNWFLLLFLYLVYTFIHELLHAFAYIINGAKVKNITFGMMLEKGILYCLCKENISKKNILMSTIFPLFFLGLVTYIIGIVCHIDLLVLLSILNISGCSGDILMFMYILKLKNIEFSEMDDPVCFAIYSVKDVSKVKHLGLKYLNKKDGIKRADKRKIVVSAFSIFLILFLLIISFM